MAGPSPETQDRTQTKDTHPVLVPDPAWNGTRAASLKGRDFTDHATATYMSNYVTMHVALIQGIFKKITFI